jgi:hypothetical protein
MALRTNRRDHDGGSDQGVTEHNVRYVLVWDIGGVIVAFAIVYFLYFR